jgi:hypothetical protein
MTANNDIIVFAHVPKCGGKSLKKGLEAAYGEGLKSHYLNPIRHRPADIFGFRLWRLKKIFFPSRYRIDAKIVYGHFCFDDIIVGAGRSIRRGAFFRDAVEWFGSYYFYHLSKYPGEFPEDPQEMIRKMRLSQAFALYLGSVSVESLDFVGITEEYEASLQLFEKIFGVTIPFHFENKTPAAPEQESRSKYRRYFEERGVLSEIEAAMAENQRVYGLAQARFTALCDQHGIALARRERTS